jgi:hypothetical protein
MSLQELPRLLIKAYMPSLNIVIDTYRFDYKMFAISKENYRLDPPAAPLLSQMIRQAGVIPGMPEFMAEINKHDGKVSGHEQYTIPRLGRPPTAEEALAAKARQIWTGNLREYKVAADIICLDYQAVIYQDIEADIGKGRVDLYYKRWDGTMYMLAVGHEGTVSLRYELERKAKKQGAGVIELIAPRPPGDAFHPVLIEQIIPLVGGQVYAA